VVTCKIKHLQKCLRASISRGYAVDVKMFYFTCNHPLKLFANVTMVLVVELSANTNYLCNGSDYVVTVAMYNIYNVPVKIRSGLLSWSLRYGLT